MPCAGTGRGFQCGAQAAWACLPRGALGTRPTGLPGDGRALLCRALVGSDSSWLLGVFGARHLIGPRWLAAVFLFRSGRRGHPVPTQFLLHLQVGKAHRNPLTGCSKGASSTPFPAWARQGGDSRAFRSNSVASHIPHGSLGLSNPQFPPP